jgi:hypothetical protein
MDSLIHGLTRAEFKKFIHDFFAEESTSTFFFKNSAAEQDVLWCKSSFTWARASGFSCPRETHFCTLLSKLAEKQKIDASHHYNMCESGVHTSVKRSLKFLNSRNKEMGIIASAEWGQFTTSISCCIAAGLFTPPLYLHFIKGSRLQIAINIGFSLFCGSVPLKHWNANLIWPWDCLRKFKFLYHEG